MHRSTVPLLVCLLLTATGLALLGLATTVSLPPAVSRAAGSGDEANAALVRRFYAAVNEVMRTGDPGPLDAVLTPTFVAHGIVPGAEIDRAGLRNHLATLRAIYADLRLTVDDLVAGQEAVVVRVAVRGGDHGAFAGTEVTPPAAPWGTADGFRIHDGRISELWGSPAGYLQPRSGISIPGLQVGSARVVLDRLGLGVGGGVAPVDVWPRLMWVEVGTVRLSIVADTDRPARQVVTVTRGATGRAVTPETVPPGGTAILREGDVAAIPGRVVYGLAAVGPGAAVALGMSMAPSSPAPPDDGIVDPRRGDAAALDPPRRGYAAVDAPGRVAGWPVGAAVEPVAAWTVVEVPAGPLSLEAGRLGLGRGAEMAMGRTPGPVLLVVEAGTLGVTAERGSVAVQQPGSVAHPIDGNAAGSPPPRAAAPTAGPEVQRVGAGGSVLLAAGATAQLAATSVGSVTCLVFALLPEQG